MGHREQTSFSSAVISWRPKGFVPASEFQHKSESGPVLYSVGFPQPLDALPLTWLAPGFHPSMNKRETSAWAPPADLDSSRSCSFEYLAAPTLVGAGGVGEARAGSGSGVWRGDSAMALD